MEYLGIDLRRQIEENGKGTYWEFLNCSVVEMSPERTVLTMDTGKFHLNRAGVVHGGVLMSLLDNAMGIAVISLHPDKANVTTSLNVYFSAPVKPGIIKAVSTVLHAGRSTITVQGTVMDEDGNIGTIATGTYRLINN